GHQAILERARSAADELRGSSLVLTFEPTPKEFFSPSTAPPRLTRFRERFELLQALELDELFCAKFGADRSGTVAELRALGARHGLVVTEVPPVFCKGERVSSTGIREVLKAGDLATARDMLGRDY